MTAENINAKPSHPDGQRGLVAVILAAGKSTRMKTDHPKVMHQICGVPMLSHVLGACRDAGIREFRIVVGFGKDVIVEAFGDEPGVRFVEQNEQKGTGHAVSMCAEAMEGFSGDVVVIAGDMPMIRSETLQTLFKGHRAAGAAASIATTLLDDPAGYGRIVRDGDGSFEKIVEHRDCTPDQLEIREVNPSYYCFDAETLFDALPKVKPDNAKGEYYITDVLQIIRDAGKAVRATTSVPAADAVGINSQADLADVSRLMQRRIQNHWMDLGVTIIDPRTTWIDSRAEIGAETEIKPFCCIEGNARIGDRCTIGPYAYIADGAVVDSGRSIGPGPLTAFDATINPPRKTGTAQKRSNPALRRPPVPSGSLRGNESC